LGRLGSIQVLEDISKSVRESRVFLARYLHTLIKKKINFSSYMVKYLRIYSYISKPFLIYDFATAPSEFP
jgi:hypothetical protein